MARPLILGALLAALPIASSMRLGAQSELSGNATAGRRDLCDDWLLIEYREEPKEQGHAMPRRGSFRLAANEWANRIIATKSLANGCEKEYTAVCGASSLRVTESCPSKVDVTKTRCLGGFGCLFYTRKTTIGEGEEATVLLPDSQSVRLTSGSVKIVAMNAGKCPPVQTQRDFNLMRYIAEPWYIQQQMEINYLPKAWNYCVMARYEMMHKNSFWGYTLRVRNLAREADGTRHDSSDLLRAYSTDEYDAARLAVAPFFIPKALSGDYWVLAYNEEEGYALISGGQPTEPTAEGCRSGTGTNGAGLWIFTRAQQRNEALVQKVRGIAKLQGFDLSVLNDVDQSKCEGFGFDDAAPAASN